MQRSRQQQRLGGAHLPDGRFHRVPAHLLQRRHPLVAVNHQVMGAVVGRDHHYDGRLLAAVSQRRQQSALLWGVAHSQVLPAPVQLVKLQLHYCWLGIQYVPSRDWSFPENWEVDWELLPDQADTGVSGLSWRDPADDFSPAWTPDGRSITFLRRLPGDKAAVMLISPLGANGRSPKPAT